jgi:hypothetical protein
VNIHFVESRKAKAKWVKFLHLFVLCNHQKKKPSKTIIKMVTLSQSMTVVTSIKIDCGHDWFGAMPDGHVPINNRIFHAPDAALVSDGCQRI